MSALCYADEGDLFIDITLISKHIGTKDNFNEVNPGIGLSYFVAKNWELRGGYFHNSYKRPTFYMAANYVPVIFDLENFTFTLGIAGGLATGYKKGEIHIENNNLTFNGITPMLAPSVTALFKPINTRVVFLLLGNALALQVSYLL